MGKISSNPIKSSILSISLAMFCGLAACSEPNSAPQSLPEPEATYGNPANKALLSTGLKKAEQVYRTAVTPIEAYSSMTSTGDAVCVTFRIPRDSGDTMGRLISRPDQVKVLKNSDETSWAANCASKIEDLDIAPADNASARWQEDLKPRAKKFK